MECLEFDDRAVYDAFTELAHQAELGDVIRRLEAGYVEDSPSGGVHWLYRCDTIGPNTKLATRPAPGGTVDTLIETRGEGGYVITAPSNGRVHPSGRAYVLRAGSFATIPTLTPDERHDLHQLAGAFHEAAPPVEARRQATGAQPGGRPGDDYNQRVTWAAVLEPHGWRAVYTRGDTTYWRRPGKDFGVSATTNYGGADLLIVFSSSTPFDTGRGYSKFSAYGILQHGGDFSAAALALSEAGFGDRLIVPVAGSTPPAIDAPWAHPLPVLLARLSQTPTAPPLIRDFLAGDGITLLHGQPREMKSLIVQAVQLSLTTGTPLFGVDRLSVPARVRTLYVTEEDSARRTAERLQALAAGMGCDVPADLFVAAGTGCSLDDPEWQARLIAFVRAESIGLLTLDPLRSLSTCVDQGPRELQPLTRYLRHFMRETGCPVLAVHHDAKPQAGAQDTRRRPQRASGGAVFSIADQPIGVDPMPDGRRLLKPTAWKFQAEPPAVIVDLEAEDGRLRFVGGEADGATCATDVDLAGRILAYLAAQPRTSGRALAEALHVRRETLAAVLKQLAAAGQLDCVQVGNASLWFPCGPLPRNRGEP